MMNNINFRRWLLAALAIPALLATAQPDSDSIPVQTNQLTVDLRFLGRGEARYGGLPAVPVIEDDDHEIVEPDKVPTSNFVLSRTRLPINFKRDCIVLKKVDLGSVNN